MVFMIFYEEQTADLQTKGNWVVKRFHINHTVAWHFAIKLGIFDMSKKNTDDMAAEPKWCCFPVAVFEMPLHKSG